MALVLCFPVSSSIMTAYQWLEIDLSVLELSETEANGRKSEYIDLKLISY